MSGKTFYITTPIYYVNDLPHIGHTFTTVLADVTARYKRLLGYDVFFLTGTDEHGQKAERAARQRGITPKELADRVVANYYRLWERLGIQYSRFIRTTDPVHRRAVQKFFRRLVDRGDIYKGVYEGWYCPGCEAFVPEGSVADGRHTDCGRAVERLQEDSYFFRLSRYQKPLLDHYRAHPEFIQPESRYNEVVRFVEAGLKDLSVSRRTVRWGIPVPDDPDHVIYVWLDALTNYISALGWADGDPLYERYWPADVHLVGKDILRFHCVYWPAFLMSAGLPLPRQVFGHGWWLRAQSKMSKSLGNIISPEELLEFSSPDMIRYYLVREAPLDVDSDFSYEGYQTRVNADLANDYGNLIHRLTSMLARFCEGRVPDYSRLDGEMAAVRADLEGWVDRLEAWVDRLAYPELLREAWVHIQRLNGLLARREPWRLMRDAATRIEAQTLLGFVTEALRLITVGVWPVIPFGAGAFLERLGQPVPPRRNHLAWGVLSPGTPVAPGPELYPRIELPEEVRSEAPSAPASPPTSPATSSSVEGLAMINIQTFMQVDLRVGEIVTAEPIEKSKKLLKLTVDLGTERRQVVAGIAQYYRPEELRGRKVVVVANLEPAVLMGTESQGMILAADVDGRPYLLEVPAEVPNGSRVR